jgi:hypothetical protein
MSEITELAEAVAELRAEVAGLKARLAALERRLNGEEEPARQAEAPEPMKPWPASTDRYIDQIVSGAPGQRLAAETAKANRKAGI